MLKILAQQPQIYYYPCSAHNLAACRFMRHRTCSLRYVPYYLRYRYQTKYPPGTADVCCFHCFTNGCLRFACFGSCCFGSCHPRRYRSPFGVMQILSISIPATFIGVVIAGLWSINRGKDLDKDSEFQEKIADPEQKEFIYGGLQEQSLLNIILPKSAYQAALVFLLGIVVIAIFGSFPQLLPHFPNAKGVLKPFSMTPTIQLMMLSIAAVIMILCNVKTSEVASGSVFKSGMTAIVSVYGVAWMADTYFGAYLPVMKKSLSDIVLTYPWMYAIVLFLVSKLINSQAAAVTVIVPMALSVGVDPLVIVGFMPAAYGYFVLPTYPSDLACIGFDRSGTTHIGKFIINHSFLVPGLIGVGSACFAGYMLVHMVY